MDFLVNLLAIWARLYPSLVSGFAVTISVALAAIPLALLGALLLTPLRMWGGSIIHTVTGAYIEFMRNTPLLLQIYLIYFGLPLLGLYPSEFMCGVIGIAMQHAAFLAEIYRGGIESISQRQWDAARAMGMTWAKALRNVILPQAGLRILGPIGNQLIILVKDTSLVSAIGVVDLTMVGKVSIERLAVTLEIFLAIALIYLALTGALGAVLRIIERRVLERIG
ncbi:MAG: amino acid ABC transporter permease [Hyphomicrobium sp.]|nr:amino acid ABC transporter permease [Hyphomicrobium sp.]